MPLSGGLGSFRKNALSSPEVAQESVGATFLFSSAGMAQGAKEVENLILQTFVLGRPPGRLSNSRQI